MSMSMKTLFNRHTPRMVVFEGLDGCGKTTQVRALQDAFDREGIPCQIIPMIPHGVLREEITKNKEYTPLTRATLLSCVFETTKQMIQEAQQEGKWVLMDRGWMSYLAYQGWGYNLRSQIQQLAEIFGKFPVPDYLIHLSITPELSQERINSRNQSLDVMETEGNSFITNVSLGFMNEIEQYVKENSKVSLIDLDGTTPANLIHSIVLDEIVSSLSY